MSIPASQLQRDAEAALVGCTWLEPCVNSKTKTLIRHDECGHVWRTIPNTIQRKSGCPKCNHGKRGKSFVSREQRDYEAAIVNCTWIGDPTIHNKKKTTLQCNVCNYIWERTPNSVKRKKGCPKCANRDESGRPMQIAQKIRDQEAAEVNSKWLEPCGKAKEKKRLLCLYCNEEYERSPRDIKKKMGCSTCTTCYVDFEGKTKVYLIIDDIAQKVGITSSNSRRDRLVTLQRGGWKKVIKTWEVPSREVALAIEAEVVDHWRFEIEAPQAYRNSERDGASESVKLKFVTVGQTIEKIEELVRKVYEEVEENG